MVFSATICATDAVAGLTMIKSDKYPKLFSILFGEGLVNDAVAIIIFLAVGDLAKSNGSELGKNIQIYKQITNGGPLFNF